MQHDLLGSVEGVWSIWIASLATLVLLSARFGRRAQRRPIGEVLADQSGAVYVLSVVLVMPFYVMLICVIVETSMMLVAKMGTNLAAFSATRAAIVWDYSPELAAGAQPENSFELPRQRAQEAARIAMIPFASGNSQNASASGSSAEGGYIKSFRKIDPDNRVANSYLARKQGYAAQATTATLLPLNPEQPEGELEVTVTYEYPFVIPIVGRLFRAGRSTSGGNNLVYPIRSQYTLPSEAPRNPQKTLGIDYLRK